MSSWCISTQPVAVHTYIYVTVYKTVIFNYTEKMTNVDKSTDRVLDELQDEKEGTGATVIL